MFTLQLLNENFSFNNCDMDYQVQKINTMQYMLTFISVKFKAFL